MSFPERDKISPVRDLEHLNILKPSLDKIKDLRKNGWIENGSPFWWSTDYAPDPREYLPFSEFKRRLVHIGKGSISAHRGVNRGVAKERDIYLYPNPAVPMTIVNLPIDGQELPCLVTARPYHEKETFSGRYAGHHIPINGIDKLRESFSRGEQLLLLDHFLPHVRGLFAGARGKHLFWYPFEINNAYDKLKKGLRESGKGFLNIYSDVFLDRSARTYVEVWEEFESKKNLVDMRKPLWVDFSYREVSAEEFIRDYESETQNLLVYYPLRVSGIEQTLPLVIANITNEGNKNRKPAVLGIYAENGGHGYTRRGGILRIKDPELAKTISGKISRDFGIPVDAVLFTPQKGRPKYERVASNN